MIKLAEKQLNHQFWQLDGDLTRDSDLSIIPEAPCNQGCVIDVSLAEVGKIDTAGLAYLIKFKEYFAARDIQVNFIHTDANLKKLAELYGVAEIVGIQE
ncbi:hypothetical protein DS2_14234 [Catenovulum agarivorans DS-2]|uniref:STAS domain-containing protein n=1 Tax=Catenovulum agarivorans DS-2 TaxID=1328313 RepID=W7Q8L1_9ALTE|nr:STAS domain-containing protein [Catenovulum agarivorans]EWH09139.1 hypothetical protein DS2_14234 [Catenovulum agarivorans DS-2]